MSLVFLMESSREIYKDGIDFKALANEDVDFAKL